MPTGDAVLLELLVARIRTNIKRAVDGKANLDAIIDTQVEGLRLLGQSWQQVGQALGVSKQAAAKKYGHLDQAIRSLGVQVPDQS